MTDDPPTISVKRAARILGVAPDTVREYLRQGTLVGMKVGRSWAVSVESVQIMLAERKATNEARDREFHERLDASADYWRSSKSGPTQTR